MGVTKSVPVQLTVWIGSVFSFERISQVNAEGAVQLALTYMSGAGMHAGTAPVATAAATPPGTVMAPPGAPPTVGDPTVDAVHTMHAWHGTPTQPTAMHASVMAPAGYTPDAHAPEKTSCMHAETHVDPIVGPPGHSTMHDMHALPQQAVLPPGALASNTIAPAGGAKGTMHGAANLQSAHMHGGHAQEKMDFQAPEVPPVIAGAVSPEDLPPSQHHAPQNGQHDASKFESGQMQTQAL